MYNGEAAEKVPGGKLVRVKVTFDNVLKEIQITGDFFLHPEECLHEIEKELKDIPIDSQEIVISGTINRIIEKDKAELVGIDSQVLAKTIRMAIENGKMASVTS